MKQLCVALACVVALTILGCGQNGGDSNAASQPPKADGPPPTQVAAKAVDDVTGNELKITVSDAEEQAETEPPAGEPAASDATAAAAPAPMAPAAPVFPEKVAMVEGEAITGAEFGEVVQGLEMRMRMQGGPGGLTDEQRRDLLNRMIDDKVLDILAEREKTEVEDAEVDAAIEEQKKRLPSPEMFEQYLAQSGKTEEDLKDMIRDALRKKKYVDNATKDLKLTEEELATVDVAHILVKVEGKNEEDWNTAKEEIDAARKRIVEGKEEFGAVAKEVSDDPGSAQKGGSYPNTPRGMMVSEFEERMFSQEIGEVSEPFRTTYGWHILTVTAKNPASEMTEEQKKEVEAKILPRKRNEAIMKLMADNRANMKVEILLDGPAEPTADGAAPAADAGAEEPKEEAADAGGEEAAPAEGSAENEEKADAS